jgi:hypothetical protein
MKHAYVFAYFPLMVIIAYFPLNVVAQSSSSENDTYPMALQRIPTKNMSESGAENDTYPMALQRIPTKN